MLVSEQTTFIKGRNILDGPLILNEIIVWHDKRKKKLMVFKVDFKKACISIRWDFLDLVMEKLVFGIKWNYWIHGCLSNARSSVLLNGSPTHEFQIFIGLRQGDPLSPFSVGHCNLSISHLMYVDDFIFMGEWSQSNVKIFFACFDAFI